MKQEYYCSIIKKEERKNTFVCMLSIKENITASLKRNL